MDDFIDPQIKKRMEQLGKLSSTRHLKLANANENDVLTEYYYSPTQRVLTEYELIGALIDNDEAANDEEIKLKQMIDNN